MNPCCSQAMLEAALSEELPPDDESRLTRHLEQCDACSAALERLAGGPAWCREAASLLAEDELDSAASREQWSEIDFTVDHLEPADDPSVLGRLGEYDVLEVIGHGGMGVVLKGFDRQLKRCVAIKVLAPHLAYNAAAKKRFAREAQAAAAVMHPNVIAIHQVQSAGRLPFLVMPLVAGESLADRLARQGPLELKEILRIGMQAAAGLAAAHEQGLVHRDVKPANILLEKGVERAVLTDFGLARAADDATLTRWGIVAGTPQYMSPEQARGEALDGRSDLFSLGCVLYEIATGVSPFRAGSMVATMRRLVDEPHQAMASLNAELPPWFITIVDRLLEKEPARRFASAREVSDLLEECLAHVQQPAIVPLPVGLPKSPSRHVWRLPRFSKLGLKGVLAMISALGAAVLGLFLYTADPPDIAGDWTSDEWGRVTLKQTADGEYQGTYTDTFGKQPGEIELKWSRIERRFNGTWREGQDRFGEISVRLAGDEIRGAFTTDEKSKLNPGTPHLVDLAWTRAAAPAAFKRPDASELSHRVPFELGAKLMRDGDRITIEEVRGTADTMKAGNYYEIKGTYRLASRDKATLAAYVTSETENVKNAGQSDTPTVTRGEGRFDLLLHMTHEGKPHVSFYPAETREGFAHVYFGTGDSVLKQGWWEHPAKNEKHKEKLDLLPSTTINVFSADGSLIGSAPGRPISPIEGWWPSVLIEDRKTKTGIGLADLALTTSDEDALIAETNRVPPLEVKALAFSPDGKTIAVGTSVGQIKLFEPRTGKLLMTLDDEKARLSDSRTPEKLKGLRRAIGDVTELAFSPDGSLLVVCGPAIGDRPLAAEKFSRLTRSITGPGRLKVWDAKTGALKFDLPGHNAHANGIAISPDGSWLASVGGWEDRSDHGTGAIIWNLQTGEAVRRLSDPANGGTWSVAFSPDSKLLAFSSLQFDKDKDNLTTFISLVHVNSGISEWRQSIPGWAAVRAFSPYGQSIVLFLTNQRFRFIDIKTGGPSQPDGSLNWIYFPEADYLWINENWSANRPKATDAPSQ